MEILIPHIVPDETVRRIFLRNLEQLYVQLNAAHGKILEGEPMNLFDKDIEIDRVQIEKAMEGIDLIHSFYIEETVAQISQ